MWVYTCGKEHETFIMPEGIVRATCPCGKAIVPEWQWKMVQEMIDAMVCKVMDRILKGVREKK